MLAKGISLNMWPWYHLIAPVYWKLISSITMKLPLQALLYILPVLPSIYALPSSRSERAARRINRRLASNSNDANRIERPTRAIASDIASPVSDAAITYTTDTAGAFYDEAAVRNTLELDVVIFALI